MGRAVSWIALVAGVLIVAGCADRTVQTAARDRGETQCIELRPPSPFTYGRTPMPLSTEMRRC